jgi:hypothetical protein
MDKKTKKEMEDSWGLEDWNKPVEPNPNLRTAGFFFASTVGLMVGLTAPFVFNKSALPYMATPKEKVRRALKFLKKGESGVFVDLGSGDGEAVYQAAKIGYRSVGMETNFTLWAFSSLRRQLFWSSAERARSSFVWGNMFDYHLQKDLQANTVMIFGVTPLMKSLSEKLALECPPGTHVLSYRFAIPLEHDEQPQLLNANIVYDQQEMRIYESK